MISTHDQYLLEKRRAEMYGDANARQEGGEHYTKKAIQPWEVIEANDMDFFEGNALKYLMRHRDKAGAKDISKAIHYLQKILERYEAGKYANP